MYLLIELDTPLKLVSHPTNSTQQNLSWQEIPAFYATGNIIIAFTRTRHSPLSWARRLQFRSSKHIQGSFE
jgi:hypothetical protein